MDNDILDLEDIINNRVGTNGKKYPRRKSKRVLPPLPNRVIGGTKTVTLQEKTMAKREAKKMKREVNSWPIGRGKTIRNNYNSTNIPMEADEVV